MISDSKLTTKAAPTAEFVRAILHYDAGTGAFTWKVSPSNRARVGSTAGALNRHTGYISISIAGRLHRAHRLAWLYVMGDWPKNQIDHINGARSDNRWENLREADSQLNQQNLRLARGNTNSGALGVYRTDKKHHPWRAAIKHDGRNKHLGNFRSVEEAQAAYVAAKREMHPGCTI